MRADKAIAGAKYSAPSLAALRSRGFTIIELIIGLSVGLFVVGAAIAFFITNARMQATNLELARLNHDMRAVMDIMTRDIRRAGFVTSNPSGNPTAIILNPFFVNTAGLPTTDITILNNGSCIVYSYNRDDDTPVAVDSNERLGFRLDDTVLRMRRSGTTNANCSNGAWEALTEPGIEITALNFAMSQSTLNPTSMTTDFDGDGCYDGDDQAPLIASASCVSGTWGNRLCDPGEGCNICVSGAACVYVRRIDITMTGRLASDPNLTQTLSERVRVRNDKYVAVLP